MKTVRQYFKIHWPGWRRLFRYWVLLGCCLGWAALASAHPATAQAVGAVSLTITLRHSDGTAVVGEAILLERLPEEELISPNCSTDASGSCSWRVARGLYQVVFERPLDAISSLAVAEGGLHGLGITVGDANIVYHFTFHSDGRVYFDAAPEAAVPQPIIPEGELLHGGVEPTAAPSPKPTEGIAMTATSAANRDGIPNDGGENRTTGNPWQLLLFIGCGLLVGGSLHLWSRKRRKTNQQTTRPENPEAENA